MLLTDRPLHFTTRVKGGLPRSGPLPATMQALGCRWLPYAYMRYARELIGSRFTVYPLNMPPLVFLTDPEEIGAVLTAPASELHPGAGSQILAPLIGERSFMLLEEDEHHQSRKAITPAFHRKMIAEHTAVLRDMVEREVAAWPVYRPIRLHPRIRVLTFEVIHRIIFGTQEDDILERLHAQLIDTFSVSTSFTLQQPNLRYASGWRGTWKMFIEDRGVADTLIHTLFARQRAEHRGKPQDLLDMLLNARGVIWSPMPDNEIRDNVMSMVLAGHETTTGELTWAFQLLAHNQSVQDRPIDEIDHGTAEDYLTATVHETLRHKPVFLFAIPEKSPDPPPSAVRPTARPFTLRPALTTPAQ